MARRAAAAASPPSTRTRKAAPSVAGSVTRNARHTTGRQAPTRFLPPAASAFLKRRAIEAIGAVPLVFAVLMALALISYSPSDHSWNVATTAPAQNWLGLFGSHMADVLVQVLGGASAVLTLVLFGWGLRVMRHMGLPRFLLHLALTPFATLLAAMMFAALPTPDVWPLPVGLGGVAGHTLLSQAVTLLTPLGIPASPWIYVPILGPLTLALTLAAMALPLQDWRSAGAGLKWAFMGAATTSGRGTVAAGRGLWTAQKKLQSLAKRDRSEPDVTVPFSLDEDLMSTAPAEGRAKTSLDTPISPKKEARLAADGPVKLQRPRKQRADDTGEDDKKIKVAAPKGEAVKSGRRAEKEAQPALMLDPSDSPLPALALLQPADPSKAIQHDPQVLEANARMLEEVLDDFGVQGDIVEVRPGPVVTVYELEPAKGTKTSRVIGLSDDIARSMSAISVRAAVVPGRSVIGIEIPNAERETVYLREMLASEAFEKAPGALNVVLGKDIEGQPVNADLAKMPHVLVAGTTGSGKSVGVNAMILSLLYQYTPEELRLIMVDPKILELSVYDDIPHLLTPVVTEPGKAVVALKWAVREMDDRYRQMAQLGVRNVASFNEKLKDAAARGETLTREVQTGFDPETNEPIIEVQELDLEPLPYIVIIVDEFADLMMMAGKDVEACVLRIAQKARAAGIHLIMATQRPSVDVVTGTIKANFPSRISFKVTAKQDSRTILGQQGAEMLLGMGDMLYMSSGGRLTRVHGPFVSDSEVEKVADFLRTTGRPNYISSVTEEDEQVGGNPDDPLFTNGDSEDDLYNQAVAIVRKHKKASTSFIQRHLKIGYNRAARLIEQMEEERLISPPNHVGKREILMDVE